MTQNRHAGFEIHRRAQASTGAHSTNTVLFRVHLLEFRVLSV